MRALAVFGLVTMMVACGEDGVSADMEADAASTPGSATVNAEGGTVSGGGAQVTIPAGAVAEEVTIEIASVETAVAALPGSVEAAGPVVAFTPHGTTFAEPVTLLLPYDGEADTVLRLDDENDTTWEVVEGATFDDGVATVQTTRFSLYVAVNRCSALCGHAVSVCGGTATMGTCVSACTSQALSPSAGCVAERQALLTCYTSTTDASAFDCAGNLLPLDTTCQAERAAAQQCLQPCPCWTLAGLEQAYVDAKAAGTIGVGPGGGAAFQDWGGCAHAKGATPDQWGKPGLLNSMLFIAMKGSQEAYFGWFGVGPLDGTRSCMVWRGDSDPLSGPTQVPPTPVSAAAEQACIDLLKAYKDDVSQHPAWTCFEQH